jgi:4-azaleucine resistance transporter AzlC
MHPAEAGAGGSAFRRALSLALPIVLGYVPVGFAYGVLADKAGVGPLGVMLMSVLVYAGSAQLIAVGLIQAAAAPLSIVLTTFVVNLRHLLMTAALAPKLFGFTRLQKALFAFEVTDETFAVHAERFAKRGADKAEAFLVNAVAQSAWVGGSFLGLVGGGLIQDVKPLGLDYALPAMFIALLAARLRRGIEVLAAVLAAVLAVGLNLAGMDQWHVILATVLAAAAAAGAEQWTRTRS